MKAALQELEGNDTLEYISYLETYLDRLQGQLRDANAQILSGKVASPASSSCECFAY